MEWMFWTLQFSSNGILGGFLYAAPRTKRPHIRAVNWGHSPVIGVYRSKDGNFDIFIHRLLEVIGYNTILRYSNLLTC